MAYWGSGYWGSEPILIIPVQKNGYFGRTYWGSGYWKADVTRIRVREPFLSTCDLITESGKQLHISAELRMEFDRNHILKEA